MKKNVATFFQQSMKIAILFFYRFAIFVFFYETNRHWFFPHNRYSILAFCPELIDEFCVSSDDGWPNLWIFCMTNWSNSRISRYRLTNFAIFFHKNDWEISLSLRGRMAKFTIYFPWLIDIFHIYFSSAILKWK